jgi:cytochrome P450
MKDHTVPTLEHISQVKILDYVIQESTRLHPVSAVGSGKKKKKFQKNFFFIARELEEDLVINSNITVPAGTTVWAPFYTIFRHPELWTDVKKIFTKKKKFFFPISPKNLIPFVGKILLF